VVQSIDPVIGQTRRRIAVARPIVDPINRTNRSKRANRSQAVRKFNNDHEGASLSRI
jgi:hypothetical protein